MNAFVFEDKFLHPGTLVQISAQVVADYKAAHQKEGISEVRVNSGQVANHWLAPPPNMLKVNWDAAVDGIRCKVGIWVIIRDHAGKVVATLQST